MQSDIVKETQQLRGKIRVVRNLSIHILLQRCCYLRLESFPVRVMQRDWTEAKMKGQGKIIYSNYFMAKHVAKHTMIKIQNNQFYSSDPLNSP